MAHLKASGSLSAVVTAGLVLIFFSGILRSNGQINTACTTTALTTFTPCFNYLTGSSRNGASPTEDCCNTLKSAMTDSIDCACLIVTGNVPVSIPFVRTLALALPQMCNAGVPVQCKATGAPLPAAAGPAILSPPAPHSRPRTPSPHPPAAPPHSHRAAAAVSVVKMEKATLKVEPPTTPPTAAAAPPLFVPKTTPAGIRPVMVPTSANSSSYLISSSPSLLLLFLAFLNMFLYY
ncbi:PREDICTED: classical arabinogalactan protein 9-like isoform X1 [Ipomoea nil]|uniref:classical arabinogalactan protein 9-like isoform X1 n=1 Tax=Ipomoea nil TaxID=35883 RepID=UPI0009012A9A|nr:PREDICTED: classical arabinogalactan protein 9-like isoform X1 [Ipomoea nil]